MSNIVRKISCNEQLYLDIQDLTNSFAIQFILEYSGEINKEKFEESINYVLENYNDSNLKLYKKNWIKVSKKLKVNKIDIKEVNLLNHEIFNKKINYYTNTFEVYLINHYEKKYILFKILHAVSDGKGALLLIDNIFKKYINEKIEKCNNSINEEQINKEVLKNNKIHKIYPNVKFTNNVKIIKNYNVSWNILKISGYKSGIISKIANILKDEFENELVKFMIPVDIRRHLQEKNLLGNMTLPIFLSSNKTDTWQEINGKLLYSLKNKEELNKNSINYLNYKSIPKSLRKIGLNIGKTYLNRKNKFLAGAIISYLGRVDIQKYSNDDFEILDFISLPIQQLGSPFSIVICEVNNSTNIVISRYKEQIEEESFKKISDKIKNNLEYEIYEYINDQSSLNVKINNCLNEILKNINSDLNNNDIAIQSEKKDYTYGELRKLILSIVYKLEKNKIKNNDTVIIYMKRSIEFIASIIACMSLNIPFIPVDIIIKNEILIDIIKDSNSNFLLLNENNNDNNKNSNIEFKKIKKIYIKNEWIHSKYNGIIKLKKDLENNYNLKDIAYKIYTSGTTGKPKGIEISYENLFNYLTWAKLIYRLNEKIVMPLFTSMSVDLTITSIFLPLIDRGKIKIFDKMFSKKILNKILTDKEINIIKVTPSHICLIENLKNANNIKKIIVGGENFSQTLAQKIDSYFNNPEIKIYNEYGPTELTVGCTYYIYESGIKEENVPIGKSIFNTTTYLLNSNNNNNNTSNINNKITNNSSINSNIVTQENEKGEIIVSGSSLSQGLINKNSDSLININGKIFYKTGDLGYINNKKLHCLGRINDQIKIRGNRVELEQINSIILKEFNFKMVYSIFKNNKIYTFIITKNEIEENKNKILNKKENLEENEIKSKISNYMQDYMIPSKIFYINDIPIKPNGKVDKEKLESYIESEFNISIEDLVKVIIDYKKTSYDEMKIEDFNIDSLEALELIENLANKVKKNKNQIYDQLVLNILNLKIKDIRKILKNGVLK